VPFRRKVPQQREIKVLRAAEIGRGLFRDTSFRRPRGLSSGRIPREEQKLPAARGHSTGATVAVRHGSFPVPMPDHENR